ncbi:hypothetical protein F4811DRAFT_552299 [Daldinia bambusicola]|nr:hypothetical protein F4811DRAFT_552299 [Daldinia bambusicola]
MYCCPDSPTPQEASSSQQAAMPAPSGPDNLVVTPTTPIRIMDHHTAPSNTKNKNKPSSTTATIPTTPKTQRASSLEQNNHPDNTNDNTPALLTPDSVRVRKLASSPDGVVFVDRRGDGRNYRDGRGYASTLESWETAAMFSDLGGIHLDSTPLSSFSERQDVNMAGGMGGDGGGIRSWFAAPEVVEYDLEQQSLLPSTSSVVFAPENHRYEVRHRRRRLVDDRAGQPHPDPSFWDYLSRTEMTVTCVFLALVMMGLLWNVVQLLESYWV